ncbi:MAG TPA: HAD-IB family hydrolase [Microthrixaceae bacterium]|nr:HAD-IB family hydrolase [Microthrixaceae bacterium]HNI34717.1 HAD-IB family hydrolase [Microthrixaceae bacterium]
METNGSVRRVAAWDFDGTITEHDTLLGFLEFVAGRRAVLAALAAESPHLVRGIRSSTQRNAAKEEVLGRVLGGRSEQDVTDAGRRYARQLAKKFRRESLDRIAEHRRNDHDLVIVSASLVYYLRPIAEDLGFDHVIGVEMEVGPDGILTGALTTPNVRREHKETRLRDWLGDEPFELWAYGDSSGDEQLLGMAHHPTWVGRRARSSPTSGRRR